MDVKVIDNFLNQDEFNSIKDVIFGDNFAWYYSPNIAYKNDPHKILESFFVHMIYDEDVIQSRYYDHFAGIFLPKIKQVCEIKSLIRIKTNFYPATENIIEHPPHNDYNFKHSKLSLFQKADVKFSRACPLSGKDAPDIKSIL